MNVLENGTTKTVVGAAMAVFILLLMPLTHALDPFGGGTVKIPATVSGGTGTIANLQADDDTKYTVAKGATVTISGFGTEAAAINSVYLFVQWSVETGYAGTNAIKVNGTDTSIIPAERDYGRWAYVDITGGSFGIDTSAEIASLTVTFTNNTGNGPSAKPVHFDYVYVVVNPQTSIPIPPTWSEDFNGTGQANPAVWTYEEGYQRNNEEQYYVVGESNGWMEGGNFVIEGRKEQRVDPKRGTMNYTSASIYTWNKYYWKYGRAQIRAKIPCLPGMWPAIWGTGQDGEWPSNGEVDILEYYNNKILANCARGTTTRWTAAWDGKTPDRSMTSLVAVDPAWKTSYHIWTIQWDDQNVRLYVDNILMGTVPQTWLVNPVTTWGPKEPFKQPFHCWLNLAIGGAGGNPSGTSFPQRYYIDYWRVWEGATDNVAPTDIALSNDTISEGLPAGTVVGNLTAADSDPAEVLRYSLVAGTGDTHNSQFTIPEFVCDNTLAGVLKTNAVLTYLDGPTRSIRVRVTDIEGATFDKVFIINVTGQPAIEVSTDAVSVDEGGTNTFGVKLRLKPASTVTVNVSRTSGDTDVTVQSGATLQFTTSDWSQYKTVTLEALEDADRLNGTAVITCTDAGGTFSSAVVTATEVENDNSPPVVDAGPDQAVPLVGGSSWSPADISPDAWFDAADASTLTESGGVVSQWRDKSGNNRHMTVGTAGYGATAWNGSLPALTFNGTSEYLEHESPESNATVTMAVVLEQANTSKDDRAFGIRGATSGNKVNFAFACDNTLRYDGAYSPRTLASSIGKHFRVATRSTTSASDYYDGRQNISRSETLPNVNGYINAGNTSASFIGYSSSKIAEGIIIYGTILPENRERIEGYFAHKWGLVGNLPLDHTYKSDPPGGGSATVTLNGDVTDADDDVPTTLWTVVSGPGSVQFANASAIYTTATMTFEGIYVLRLTAADNLSQTFDECVITVGDLSDMAVLGKGQTIADGDDTPSTTDDTAYGTVAIGNEVTHTFTIKNIGNAMLNFDGAPVINVSNSDGGTAFSVTVQPSSTALAASAETTFLVKFKPTIDNSGDITAIISISNDDPDENPYTFVVGATVDTGGATPTVVNTEIFYNNSAWDGDPGASTNDDLTIATDKSPLLTTDLQATFSNYTSYLKGINGIMIDVANYSGTPTAADFTFKVGNTAAPTTDAPSPTSVTARDVAGGRRITLIWADDTIKNTWLQVTVKVGGAIGLASPHVFYYGNAVAETGNSASDTAVDVYDMLGARNNVTEAGGADVENTFDFNRDKAVDVYDMLGARNNVTDSGSELKLITIP